MPPRLLVRAAAVLLVAACGAQPTRAATDAAAQQDFANPVIQDFSTPPGDDGPVTTGDAAPPPDMASPVDLAGADLTTVPDLVVVDLAGADESHPAQGDIAFAQSYAGGNAVAMPQGSVGVNVAVTVVTQTTPRGAAMKVLLHWTTASMFSSQNDSVVTMTLDTMQPVPGNDQWYGIIPGQSSGTSVQWYVESVGWDGASKYYSNFSNNFHYTVQ